MRLRYALTLALGSILIASAAIADTGYVANLNGAQENPPVITPATGTGIFILNNAQTQLSYNVSYQNLLAPRTAAHFHVGAVGVNGPVVFGIAGAGPQSDVIAGVWNLSATDVANLNNGLLYVNVHSTQFPGGEIRGQLRPDITQSPSTTWGRIKRLYAGR